VGTQPWTLQRPQLTEKTHGENPLSDPGGAQARPGIPVLAGRRPCGDDLQRGCDAGKAGLYPPEPGEAGVCGQPRALAVFERAELPRRAGADRDRLLVLRRRDAGASRAAFPRWSVGTIRVTTENFPPTSSHPDRASLKKNKLAYCKRICYLELCW
jgi:hypothetical protein